MNISKGSETRGNTTELKIGRKARFPVFIMLLFIISSTVLLSCQNDDDYYSLGDIWLSMGFIDMPANGDEFTIKLDNGDTIVPIASEVPYFRAKNLQRVMVNYTILDEVGQSTKQFYVKINNLYDVLYKDIIVVNSSNNDSIGNDPVQIDNIWKSNNLLNIEFSYLGGDVIHYINLVRPEGELTELSQPILLELRHNTRGDALHYPMRSIVTFDLKNIEIAGQDSVGFIVKSIDFDGNDHTFKSTYHY